MANNPDQPTPKKSKAIGPEEIGQLQKKSAAKGPFYSEREFVLWAAGIIGVSMVFGLQSYYPSYIGPLSNVLPALGAFVAFGSALLCWRRYGFGVRHRFELIWLLFSAGTGLWVMAEVTWAAYYFVLNVSVPYPSAADFFYVGGYLPMLAGLVLYLGTFSTALSGRRLAIAIVAIACAVTLALGLVVPAELSRGLQPLDVLTDLAYPVLDLALFSLTMVCLAIFLGGSISKWWILFGGASLLYVVGDEFFLYQVATNVYYNGSFDDLLFIFGYLTFALAFFAHRREF